MMCVLGQRPDKNATEDDDRSVSRRSWSSEPHWLGSRTLGKMHFIPQLTELMYNESLCWLMLLTVIPATEFIVHVRM